MRRVQVCAEREVHAEKGIKVSVEGRDIALFRRGGRILALSNVCAHQHLSVLHQGQLEGMTVTCPMHGWTYDLVTGKGTADQGAVAPYPVSVERGCVSVDVPDGV